MATRVYIAARSPLVRAGIEAMLAERSGIAVAASASSLSAETLEAAAPDVVVLDAGAGDDLRADLPLLPAVLLVTGDTPRAPTRPELEDGVRAILPAGATGDELVAAIHAAAAGLVALPLGVAHSILNAGSAGAGPQPMDALTPRESEVLGWMVHGVGNKTIAHRLGISEHTVKAHVAAILAKLGAASRTEAVTIGIRYGLVIL